MFKKAGAGRFPLFSLAIAGPQLIWKGAAPRADKPARGATPALATPPRVEEAPSRRRMSGFWVLLPWAAYLGIIAAAELSMAGNPSVALALYAYLLFFLLAHALLFRPAEMPLAAALALAPATRIHGLLAGAAEPGLPGWYLLTGVSLVAVGALVAGCLGLSRRQLGLTPGRLGHQLAVALLGLPLAVAGYLLPRPSYLEAGMSGFEFWVLALLLLLATGPAEEFLFRGVVQSTAQPVLGRWGMVYASGLFALLQTAAGGAAQGIYWFLVGLAFAWLVARTGSLLGVGLAHGLASAGIYLVIPLLLVGSTPGGTTGADPGGTTGGEPALRLAAQAPYGLPGVARPGPSLGDEGSDWAGRRAGGRPGSGTGAAGGPGTTAGAATPSADQKAVLGATPVAAPAAAGTARPEMESYTVQPGDSLFGIAESRGTTVEELMSRNGLTDRASIYAGREILVPPQRSAARP